MNLLGCGEGGGPGLVVHQVLRHPRRFALVMGIGILLNRAISIQMTPNDIHIRNRRAIVECRIRQAEVGLERLGHHERHIGDGRGIGVEEGLKLGRSPTARLVGDGNVRFVLDREGCQRHAIL